MAWIYADYLSVRRDLVDVYTAEVDRTSPHLWQAFIPHRDMYQLLSRLLDSLERQGKDQTRSLWLHGAYGTGKTFAAFVVKHLLEDPLEAVEAYLTRHNLTRNLWPRFQALRQRGPYLIVARSSAAHIDSSLKFMVQMQEDIKRSLAGQGYDHGFAGACLDEVLRYLTHPDSTFHWEKAFQRYRWQEFPSFAEPQEVINAIDQGDLEAAFRVAKILEQERALLLADPARMKAGLRGVIDKNNLQGIIYIWDEFTDFFRLNPTLSDLQELAHATTEIPFYLLLVTHKSPGLVSGDQETMRRLLERFHTVRFHLEPITAYRLAGNALEIRGERQEEWESKRETLWEQVRPMAEHLFDQESELEDFARLVPLQPYTAFLLSTIAGAFSSSQRSLFHFLKSDRSGGFVWFLREYPQADGWFWFTPDLLWDYFFGEEALVSELTERVREVVNFCRNRLVYVDDAEAVRLFKGIMLFLALSREMRGGGERLSPCRRNLALAFQGTPLLDRLGQAEEYLQAKGCLNLLGHSEEEVEYTLPLYNLDERRLRDIRDQIERNDRFDQLVRENREIGRDLQGLFTAEGIAAPRVVLVSVSSEELSRRREYVQPALQPYQVGFVLVACLNENQLTAAEELAAQCAQRSERVAYLVLQAPFTKRRWERWQEQLAHERYCQEINDEPNRLIYQQRKTDQVTEWVRTLEITTHRLFWGQEQWSCQGKEGFKRQVANLIERVFPAGPEKISTLGTLYTGAYGVGTFKIGLGVNPNITRQFLDLVEKLTQFERNPTSNPVLVRLQAEVRQFFQGQHEVSLAKLWQALQEPPFGLFPSPLSAVLLGFLVKDICRDHYWSDGINCFPLNPDKMADLLLKIVKKQRGYQDIVIRKITPLAENFCRYVKEVFNIRENGGNYPEDLKGLLRQNIQRLGYPLWALNYVSSDQEVAVKAYLYFLQCFLMDFEAASQGITLNEAELEAKAEQAIENWKNGHKETHTFEEILAIINLLSENEPVRASVRQTISPENLAAGMGQFIEAHHPELARELTAQGLGAAWVVRNLRDLLQEEVWLWQEEVVKDKLAEVYANLLLLTGVNQLCGLAEEDLAQALDKCKEAWLIPKTKLPLRFYTLTQEGQDREQAKLYQDLDALMTGQRLPYEARARLGQSLQQDYLSVREDVADQSRVLTAWVNRQWGQTLTAAEARSLLEALPNLALEKDDQIIQQEIRSRWEQLQHHKLITEIQAIWQQATGTPSPADWSRQQRLPLTWILSDPWWQQFCADFGRLASLSDEILADYGQKLQEQAEILQKQLQEASAQKLAEVLLPEYADVFQDGQRLAQLQDYLVDHIGEDVEQWPARLTELQAKARQWLREYYKEIFWPEVQATLATLPVEQAKNLLQELVQEPGIGIRLWAKVRRSHGQRIL